jgi:hypothetical protein
MPYNKLKYWILVLLICLFTGQVSAMDYNKYSNDPTKPSKFASGDEHEQNTDDPWDHPHKSGSDDPRPENNDTELKGISGILEYFKNIFQRDTNRLPEKKHAKKVSLTKRGTCGDRP